MWELACDLKVNILAPELFGSKSYQNEQKTFRIANMGCPFFQGAHFPGIKRKIAYPEAHGLFAGQKPPEAALAADRTSVLSADA